MHAGAWKRESSRSQTYELFESWILWHFTKIRKATHHIKLIVFLFVCHVEIRFMLFFYMKIVQNSDAT